jgi:hypothetical protein
MVNVLWERGDVDASMNLEDQFDQLIKKRDIAVFCSFLMDNFNDDVHARMLPRLGTNHSHLIPVEDYARLERAVGDALRNTVGPDEGRVLESQLLTLPTAIQHAAIPSVAAGTASPSLPVADSVLQRSRERMQLLRSPEMAADPPAERFQAVNWDDGLDDTADRIDIQCR